VMRPLSQERLLYADGLGHSRTRLLGPGTGGAGLARRRNSRTTSRCALLAAACPSLKSRCMRRAMSLASNNASRGNRCLRSSSRFGLVTSSHRRRRITCHHGVGGASPAVGPCGFCGWRYGTMPHLSRHPLGVDRKRTVALRPGA
jgi:hypothetical protein